MVKSYSSGITGFSPLSARFPGNNTIEYYSQGRIQNLGGQSDGEVILLWYNRLWSRDYLLDEYYSVPGTHMSPVVALIEDATSPETLGYQRTRHMFAKHGCPLQQQSRSMAKICKSYILTSLHPLGRGMSVKCERTYSPSLVTVSSPRL